MQDRLTELRRSIDAIDDEILGLLSKRLELVLEVGQLKKGARTAIYDPAREEEMLERLAESTRAPLPESTVRKVFSFIIAECRTIEQHSVHPPENPAPRT